MAYSFIIILASVTFLLYGLCIAGFTYGWLKLKHGKIPQSMSNPATGVSVVVAVRNEEKNLHSLLRHLTAQDYPTHLFEIILVNDHSRDDTAGIIYGWQQKSDMKIRLLNNKPSESGKKAALKNGIENARGELILTTDADCIMGKKWVESMVTCYESEKKHMILGPVLYSYQKSSAFELFQALEFISLLATSAGAAALNRPLFCNAANMAFTRKIFKELYDPFSSDTPSGDDTLLLLSIKRKYPGNIHFNSESRAMVETAPEKTLKNFWNQRKRWVSKSSHYRDFDILATAFIVAGANLLLIIFLILMLLNPLFIYYFIAFFLFKIIIDAILLFPVIGRYKRYNLLKAYLPSQLIYPFYVAASALGGKLSGFKWKNRYYHAT